MSTVLKYYSRVPVLLLRGLDCPLALHLVYELLRKSSPYWLETVNIMHGRQYRTFVALVQHVKYC